MAFRENYSKIGLYEHTRKSSKKLENFLSDSVYVLKEGRGKNTCYKIRGEVAR